MPNTRSGRAFATRETWRCSATCRRSRLLEFFTPLFSYGLAIDGQIAGDGAQGGVDKSQLSFGLRRSDRDFEQLKQ